MQNILFLGDSLTAGYGLRDFKTEAFPALIEKKIKAEKFDYHVINAGLSGDTSAGGLNRIEYWITQHIDILVLELGINDVIRGISPLITGNNLQQIIDKVKGKYPQVKIAIMGMQIPAFLHSPFTQQFNDIFPVLAQKNKAALYPFFLEGVAGKHSLNLPDRLHPSAEGYKIIANNAWPVIRGLLV